MEGLFESIRHGLIAPELDLKLAGEPAARVGQYNTSNELGRTIAHLAATYGRESHLLKVNSGDMLLVHDNLSYAQDSAMAASLASILSAIQGMASDMSAAASNISAMATILNTVFDATGSAIFTNEIP